jgi:hypothetical protein
MEQLETILVVLDVKQIYGATYKTWVCKSASVLLPIAALDNPRLGAFAKLRKANISFVLSVRHPTAGNNSAPIRRIFMNFYI